ncbi:hypothetical protein Tco_0529813 [Tanacetum coccineum]
MLERGSYIPWASHFRRYLNRKRENRKWLNKANDEGPYEFKDYVLLNSQTPTRQTEEVLTGDDLKHYEVKIEAMNLILISIPNEIYNSVDACTTAKAMWERVERLMQGTVQNKVNRETRFNNEFDQFVAEPREALVAKKLEKSHDPLALVAHTGSSSRTTLPYYVTHPSSVVDYDDDYQGDAVQNKSEDPLLNSGNDGRNTRRSYVQEEVIEVRKDEAGITLTDEHNDFLFADATRMEEIEELRANMCLMAKIQPTNINFDVGPSYDSAFLSEVQTLSTSYVNPLFVKDNQEHKYPKQLKIINNTIGDDQIDSNIIFDEPIVDVKSGSVEHDNNVQASYALEQLALNAYKEAEKQQIKADKVKQQNKVLTQQLELYKEKVQILEDATKSQMKMENKLKDPIAIEKKQNVHTIDYNKLNALYEDFVLQKELSAEQKYFSSTFIPAENHSNASTSASPSEASMPSNNHECFVAAPKFSEFFLNELGFTLELRSPSNFKTIGLVQPWQTLCKMFSRCLTTRVTSYDQPPLQILQMLYCFVNNIHVDYADLLWEGLHYSPEHPSTLISYPKFTKLIISRYMIAFPEISKRVRDKYHNLEHDEIVKSIFSLGKNKVGVGIKILVWMITSEMKLTENYQMYVAVFGVDVPTTQLQPIESTQGMHRTTSTSRSPNPDVDEGESSAPRKSTVIRLHIPPRRLTRLTLPTPTLTTTEAEDIIIQDTIQLSIVEQKSHDDLEAKQNVKKVKEHLIAEEIEKLVEGTENVENTKVDNSISNSNNDPVTRLDPESHKESLEVEITIVEQPVNVIEEEEESVEDDYELRRRENGRRLRDVAVYYHFAISTFPVEIVIKSSAFILEYLLQLPIKGLIMERQQSQADVAKMIAEAIQQERKNLWAEITSQINNAITSHIPSQVDSSVRNYMSGHILHVHPTQASQASAQEQQYQLYLTMKDNPQLQHDDLPIWLALKIKFEGLHASNTPCRASDIPLRDQDDPHDDAHPEGENNAKRQKTFEHGTMRNRSKIF